MAEIDTPIFIDSRPVLIIDAMNLFIAHFACNPTMSSNGYHVGGVVGFINAIRNLSNLFRPKRIIVAWESNGSTARRALHSDYKEGRRPLRLNRFYGQDIPDSDEVRARQTVTIVNLLKHATVTQLYVLDCEADDIIGYICISMLRHENKIIVSSDKDFYQLVSNNTTIYRPIKKVLMTHESVIAEMGISPINMVLARAICGDVSDNIPGVRGLGLKTLCKRFPSLKSDIEVDINELLTECNIKMHEKNAPKLYTDIINAEKTIRLSMRLMRLDVGLLAQNQIHKIDHLMDVAAGKPNRLAMMEILSNEGISGIDVDSFFFSLNNIN